MKRFEMRNIASCAFKWFVIFSFLSSCLVKCNLEDFLINEEDEIPITVADEIPSTTSPPPPTTTTIATPEIITTTTTTRSNINSSDDSSTEKKLEEILKDNPRSLTIIFDLLRKVQANQCVYGADPKLNDLCPDLMSVRSYADAIPNLNELRFSDVRARIIDDSIVRRLIQECDTGQWCLNDVLVGRLSASRSNATSSNSSRVVADQSFSLLSNNTKLFCLVESCYKNIEYYMEKCVKNNFTSHVVQLAPEFCNFDIENTQNKFCVENSLRLIHVSAAYFELSFEEKKPTPDVCRNEIENKTCSTECGNMAMSINKLTSCCGDTKLIKNFKSFGWYFDNFYQVRRNCKLPLKSICLSEGKYYLGISPTILVILLLTSACLASFITTIFYFICCRRRSGRRNKKVYETSADLYEYAHLNPCVEDENISMNPANLGDDEFALAMHDRFHHTRHHHKQVSVSNMSMGGSGSGGVGAGDDEKLISVDMNNNNGDDDRAYNGLHDISRFVNKHQTDIRGLLN